MSAARADYAEAEFTFVISLTDPEEFQVYIISITGNQVLMFHASVKPVEVEELFVSLAPHSGMPG